MTRLRHVLLAVLVAAAFAAGVSSAATITDTTESTPTVTAPVVTVTTERTVATTVQQTVQQTVTKVRPATTAPLTTTSSSSSGSSFPTWAIVLIVIGGIGLIAAVAFLLGRGKRSEESSVDGRRRILDAAVASAVASGWTVESSGPVEAVLRHNGERTMLSVDEHGQVNRRRLESDERPG